MKNLSISLLVAGIISVFGASSSMAGMVRPELVAGINDMTNNGGAMGFAGGLDLVFGAGPTDFTVGGEYLSRAFSGGISNINYIHVPGLIHFHFGPMFSLGLGGFYDFGVTSGAPSDYGLTGAIRLKPAMAPIFLEGRFNYGLNTTDWGTATQEFEVVIGFIL